MKRHVRDNCNKLKKYDYCHATGHVLDDCFMLIGYPENFKGKKKIDVAMAGVHVHVVHHQQQATSGQQMVKKANTIIGDQSTNNDILSQDKLTHLMTKATPNQFQQLLKVLNANMLVSYMELSIWQVILIWTL